jgi:hypothetical protein
VNHLEGSKTVAKISTSVAANATHSHEIDTYGHDYLSVDVVFSPFTAATTSYASVLKLQQSDASGSGQTDVSGLSVTSAGSGSTTGATIGAIARFNLDCRAIKRYVTVVATPGNTVAVATAARLGKSEDMPYNAKTAGVNDFVSG